MSAEALVEFARRELIAADRVLARAQGMSTLATRRNPHIVHHKELKALSEARMMATQKRFLHAELVRLRDEWLLSTTDEQGSK